MPASWEEWVVRAREREGESERGRGIEGERQGGKERECERGR